MVAILETHVLFICVFSYTVREGGTEQAVCGPQEIQQHLQR